MHGLTVYVKEGLPFARDLSLENSADSYLCFRLALLHSVPYFFSLYRSPSSSLCTIFYSISSNLDEVLSINPTAVFVFGDFSIHRKDWLTYSSGAGRLGELGYNFSISNDKTRYSVSSRTLRLFSCWLGWSSWSLERCSWEDNFKLSASAAASEYCEWVQVVINVVKPHLSAWFSAGCAAAIVHRNHFPRLYYRINLLNLKWSSDRLIIVAKGLLKLQNLHMLLKLKNPSLPRNLALKTFGELLTVFSTKVNLLYLLYSTTRRCCLLQLIKCSLTTFLRTLILMTQVSFYLFSLLALMWKCKIFP